MGYDSHVLRQFQRLILRLWQPNSGSMCSESVLILLWRASTGRGLFYWCDCICCSALVRQLSKHFIMPLSPHRLCRALTQVKAPTVVHCLVVVFCFFFPVKHAICTKGAYCSFPHIHCEVDQECNHLFIESVQRLTHCLSIEVIRETGTAVANAPNESWSDVGGPPSSRAPLDPS